jgi:hypothetical protein
VLAVLIEVRTFRLAAGVDEPTFLAADAEAQARAHLARGIVRRTTARGGDGRWLVLSFWYDAECADGAGDDGLAELVSDERVERYDDIGG